MTEKRNKIDLPLLTITVLLVGFGILMVYSASSYGAEINYGNKYY